MLLAEVAAAFVAADPDDAAPRRALLAPLLSGGEADEDGADEPVWAADLLGFAQVWRGMLYVAYGNATELPAAQHAMANLTLRLEAVGPGSPGPSSRSCG